MEDIERARIQNVIHESANRDMSFRQLSCMGTELLLKEVKFVAGTGVCRDKEFCIVGFGAEDGRFHDSCCRFVALELLEEFANRCS
jgi:hypothetical protein